MSDFSISTEGVRAGVQLINVSGFLDAHTFERLQAVIDECFERKEYNLVVDLSRVDYISSAGAGVFIGAIGTAHEHQGNIVLLNPTENVREVFDLLGLSLIFTFAGDIKEAVSALAP